MKAVNIPKSISTSLILMNTRLPLVAIVLVMLLLIGCSENSDPTKNIRTNTVPPIEVEHVLSIFESDEDYINYTTTLITTPQGEIIFNDPDNHRLMVYGTDGQFRQQIGRSGSGPGEFLHLITIIMSPDGKLYVPDLRQARTTIFHKPDQEWIIDRVLTHTESGMYPQAVNGTDAVFRASLSQSPTPEVYTYKHWIASGSIEDDIELGPKIEVDDVTFLLTPSGDSFSMILVPYSTPTLTKTDNQGNLYMLKSGESVIRKYNAKMEVLDTIQIQLDPVPTTTAELDSALVRSNQSFHNLIISHFPTHKSLVVSFHVDDEGRYWLETNDSPKYVVLDSTGNPIGSFDVPEGLRFLHASQNRLYFTSSSSEPFRVDVYEAKW